MRTKPPQRRTGLPRSAPKDVARWRRSSARTYEERCRRRAQEDQPSRRHRARATSPQARRRREERQARNWERAYGSLERVLAVQDMRCLVPGCLHPAVNAHTKNGGMSRKADARWVANICEDHHTRQDDSLHHLGSVELFDEMHEVDAFGAAAAIERMHPTLRSAL